MVTLATSHPTILDWSKHQDPKGKVAKIVEILNQKNQIYEDALFVECNKKTSHETTVRTGISEPTFRKIYGLIQPTKGTVAKVTASCGMMEALSEADCALADIGGPAARDAFRDRMARAHLEGFGQKSARYSFYGDEKTEPEAFTGFLQHFNDQSAANGENILTSAATPDENNNTSIWLVCWGEDSVYYIFPEGSQAGIQHIDFGKRLKDEAGGSSLMYTEWFRQDVGLVIADWRYVVRINIDQEDLTKNASAGPDLIDLMTEALELPPSLEGGVRPVFYTNRRVRSFLRRQIVNKTASSTLSWDGVSGKPVMMFGEVPVKRCDAIHNNEAGV